MSVLNRAAFTVEDLVGVLEQRLGVRDPKKLRRPLRRYLHNRHKIVLTNGEWMCLFRPCGTRKLKDVKVGLTKDGLPPDHELVSYNDLQAKQWREQLIRNFPLPPRKRSGQKKKMGRKKCRKRTQRRSFVFMRR